MNKTYDYDKAKRRYASASPESWFLQFWPGRTTSLNRRQSCCFRADDACFKNYVENQASKQNFLKTRNPETRKSLLRWEHTLVFLWNIQRQVLVHTVCTLSRRIQNQRSIGEDPFLLPKLSPMGLIALSIDDVCLYAGDKTASEVIFLLKASTLACFQFNYLILRGKQKKWKSEM